MRKGGLLGLFLIFLVFASLSFLHAQTLSNQTGEVDKAYECLSDLIDERTCGSLSTEEKIFSLLALDECGTEVNEDSSDGECWPKGDCNLKTTAQAVLALDNTNQNTGAAQNWLLSQNATPPQLVWYLQIESSEATSCTINYKAQQYSITIGEDKKISSSAGSCLSLSGNEFWLQVSPTCYNEEIKVSCNDDFRTNLLFQRQGSDTIHVLGGDSSSAGGETTEKVESFCFAENNVCSYEGSLWAALVLSSLDKDVSAYLPYLITLAEDENNQKFLPSAFLYYITANIEDRASLLSEQISNKWWSASGDKYYDTAVALFPLQGESPPEKANAKAWLFDTQDESGCWDSNNLRNTAFILASVWPKTFSGGGSGVVTQGCESAGYYCVGSSSICIGAGGAVFEEFSCPGGLSVCCTQDYEELTCGELDGYVCRSPSQICPSGSIISGVSGLLSGEVCCALACQLAPEDEPENEPEDEIPSPERKSYAWIWILSILIILVILGIVYKDKLKKLLPKLKFKSKRRGPGPAAYGPGPGRPYRPQPPPYRPPARHFPRRTPGPGRRVIPRTQPQRPAPASRPKPRANKELVEVLKKLKEMGK
jgi:hypothetical protein